MDEPDYISPKEVLQADRRRRRADLLATLYRGIKAGRYPPFEHPSPGISRHRRTVLIASLNKGGSK